MKLKHWYNDIKNLDILLGAIAAVMIIAGVCLAEDEYERAVESDYQISQVKTTTTTADEKIYTYEEICAGYNAADKAVADEINTYATSKQMNLDRIDGDENDGYYQGFIDQLDATMPAKIAEKEAIKAVWQERKTYAENNGADGETPKPEEGQVEP